MVYHGILKSNIQWIVLKYIAKYPKQSWWKYQSRPK